MPDPRTQLLSFPLTLGVDQISDPERVQPFGDKARLAQSLNTRLTKVPGIVSKAPGVISRGSGLAGCGGLIPHGVHDSTLACFHPGNGGNRRLAGSGVALLAGTLAGTFDSGVLQSSYWPVQVARAGTLATSSLVAPAVCYDASTGYTYYAKWVHARYPGDGDPTRNFSTIVLTVLDDANSIVIAPTPVVNGLLSVRPLNFVGLTNHGAGLNLLWYCDDGGGPILCAALTISGTTVTVSAATMIYDPSVSDAGSIALACDPLDTGNVYVISYSTAGTDTHISRVNPATRTVSTGLTIVTGATAPAQHAIAYVHDGTSGTLIWQVNCPTGFKSRVFGANPTSLATIWSLSAQLDGADETPVSCGFYKVGSVFKAVFAATKGGTVTAVPGTAGFTGGTLVGMYDAVDGSDAKFAAIPWQQMVAQVCTFKVENTTQWYPLFATQAVYDVVNRYEPTHADYVPDPSVEALRVRLDAAENIYFDLLGRFGTDTATRYPAVDSGMIAEAISYFIGCNSFVQAGTSLKAKLAYLADNLIEGRNRTFVVRYVDLDFAPTEPRFALLASGQAIIAGALPAVWDGVEVTQVSPIREPKLYGVATGGTGPTFSGVYTFQAVISWKDAAGKVHRSAPSNTITLTISPASSPRLWVTSAPTYRNGITQGSYQVTIYASQNNATTVYAQRYEEAGGYPYGLYFPSIAPPVQNALTPAIYSDGSATSLKPSVHPNACIDVKVVSDRVWTLDAEQRGRAWYSQPMNTEALADVFATFNPTQYVDFPAAAGQLLAIEEWRGRPYFMTTTGVWTVDGEGPDALNNPPFFAGPSQVLNWICDDRLSVVSTPVGILFRTRNRYVLFGERFQLFDADVLADQQIAGTAVFRDQHEVVLFTRSGLAHVYNYVANAWSTWGVDALSAGFVVTAAIQVPASRKALYYSATMQQILQMDPATVSSTAQIGLFTGWIVPGGPQDDAELVDTVLHALRGGVHGVTVTISTDYGAAQPAKAYSTGEVALALVAGRYDLWPQPRDMRARAMRIQIQETDATGEGFQGVNATLEVVRNSGKAAAPLRQSGRK